MNEIRITIEGLKELTEAVRVLAGMGGGQAAVASAPQTQPPVPGTATAGQIPAGAPVQPPQIHTGVPVQQPQVPTAAPQNYGQASVQPTVPVAMGAQPPQGAAVPAAVPTTAMPQRYTLDQLSVAAAGLTQMGRMPQVMGILQQFGIQAIMELPKERYGEFATALREAGAQI